MGRRARFDKEQIIGSALSLIAEDGPGAATVAAIAGRVGAPTGSIYHRFSSRELLLAELWLTVVKEFQDGMIAEFEGEDDAMQAGVNAALYMPRWVRGHLNEARLLLLHRREDFISGDWPDEMRERATDVRNDMLKGVGAYSMRMFGNVNKTCLRRVRFALLDVPYGAVKYYVQTNRKPPRDIDTLIEKACIATLSDYGGFYV